MKWSHLSPYFHAVVWLFNLTLLSVWLWEMRARNVTPKNIPAALTLMTVSLALALLNTCAFLLIGGTHELDIGGESTRQWMCALCGTLAIVGQYLVRVSVWAFFVVRGSLVTSFHPRLNQIARATPYVLLAHACLFVVLCVLFVDVGRGHGGGHSHVCHVHKFPLWLLFVGPMAGDLFYGIGFFLIFYKTMKSSFLESIKSLSMRERIATERLLRRNLALFVLQLLSTTVVYVLILSMNFSFTSFELAEMNVAITNVCLFGLFQGRTKVYPCCSRVLCPEVYDNLLRHEEVQRELRGEDTLKRRAAIDAFRKKEKDKETRRKSFAIEIELTLDKKKFQKHETVNSGSNDAREDDDDSDEKMEEESVSRGRSVSLPILGDDRVFSNRWKAGDSAVVKLPAVAMSHALGSAIGVTTSLRRSRSPLRGKGTEVPPTVTRSKTVSIHAKSTLQIPSFASGMCTSPEASKSSTLAVPMGAFANVLESEHLRMRSVTISSKASKLLGVSEALVGLDLRHRKKALRILTSSQSADVTELVSELHKRSCTELPRIRAASAEPSPCVSIDSSLLRPSRRCALRSPPPIPEESSSYEYYFDVEDSDESSSELLPLGKGKGTSALMATQSAMVTLVGSVKRMTGAKKTKEPPLAGHICATTSLPVRKAQIQNELRKGESQSHYELGSDFEGESVVSGALSYSSITSSARTTKRLKSISSWQPQMQAMAGGSLSDSVSLPLADVSEHYESDPLSLVCCTSSATVTTSVDDYQRTLRTLSLETGKQHVIAFIE